jgi:hypothetical protein
MGHFPDRATVHPADATFNYGPSIGGDAGL